MARWTCPECDRSFGRRNQTHVCHPGKSVEEWFADQPPADRAAFDEVREHLESLGPVHIEAVDVGIFFKRSRTFAELRPKRDHLTLSVLLSHRVDHPRVTKTLQPSATRAAIFVDVKGPDDVDDLIRDWLTESYFGSPE